MLVTMQEFSLYIDFLVSLFNLSEFRFIPIISLKSIKYTASKKKPQAYMKVTISNLVIVW